jgi:hypothetical protein
LAGREGLVEEVTPVERLVRPLTLHLKSIEDDLRVGRLLLDGFDVGLGHVNRHVFQQLAPVRSEFVEERLQGVSVLPGLAHTMRPVP